ncbi:hypothetical protein GFM44_39365 [Rhizobium leguminosarum bv. viciae]|nr:hypothetical protein [Rhizobium leguminosarum bv. viciae]
MFSAPSYVQLLQASPIRNLIKPAFVPNPGSLAGHDRGRNFWAPCRFSPFANRPPTRNQQPVACRRPNPAKGFFDMAKSKKKWSQDVTEHSDAMDLTGC